LLEELFNDVGRGWAEIEVGVFLVTLRILISDELCLSLLYSELSLLEGVSIIGLPTELELLTLI
jgi:hypothetical protein